MGRIIAYLFLAVAACGRVGLQGDAGGDPLEEVQVEGFDDAGGSEDLPGGEEGEAEPPALEIECRGSGGMAVGEPCAIGVTVLLGGLTEVRWSAVEFPEGSPPVIEVLGPTEASVTADASGSYVIEAAATGLLGEERICTVSLRAVDPTEGLVAVCPGDMTFSVPAFVTLEADVVGGEEPLAFSWTPLDLPEGVPPEDLEQFSSGTRALSLSLVTEGAYRLSFEATDASGAAAACETRIEVSGVEGFEVVLTWNPPDHSCLSYEDLPACDPTDLDLHLGNLGVGYPGWFGSYSDCCAFSCVAGSSHLPDWDEEGPLDDPILYRDDRSGYGPEAIAVKRPATSHEYVFAVHMYDREISDFPPFPAVATVEVYCGGTPEYSSGPVDLGPYWDEHRNFWVVGTIAWDGPGCRVDPLREENGDLIIRWQNDFHFAWW